MRRVIPPRKTKHSAQIVCLGLAFLLVALTSSPALALDPMGPPASTVWKGDYRLGFDYSFSQMDIDMVSGSLTGATNVIDLTLNDFEVHRAYATLGYGFSNSIEGFVRLGGANATFGDTIWRVGEEFDGGIDFTIGAGVKATFYENDLWRFGALAQASYAEFDGKLDANVDGWIPDSTEVDILQVQAAAGATYRWTDRLSLYAGPFVYMVMGDFDDSFPAASGNSAYSTLHWDLDSDLNFGAYIGAHYLLRNNCACTIEYQLAGNANVIGLGIMWKI